MRKKETRTKSTKTGPKPTKHKTVPSAAQPLAVVTRQELTRVAEVLMTIAESPFQGQEVVSAAANWPFFWPVDIIIVRVGDVCTFKDVPDTVKRGKSILFWNATSWWVKILFAGDGAQELNRGTLVLRRGSFGSVNVSPQNIGTDKDVKFNMSLQWSKDGGRTWLNGTGGGPDMGIQDPP
jgi:hypothetical protein